MKKLMSILLTLVLLAACFTVSAEAATEDYICIEEFYYTRIPAGATTEYKEDSGLTIYTKYDGKIPFVNIVRRSMENKFKNPEGYLNNVYREYLEDQHGDKFQGMNPAKTWNVGGKDLLGARYMYLVGETPVTLVLVLEIRDGGDVQYMAKFTDDTEDITMAALNTAVEYYQELDMGLPEDSPTGTEETAPSFLIPYEFVGNYNSLIDLMAEMYADQLTEDEVKMLTENYKFVQKDAQGVLVYYGTGNWGIEAGFAYPDGTEPTDTTPAQLVNFAIKTGVPDLAAEFATIAFKMVVAYEYQDDALTEQLNNWFAAVRDSSNVFELPGYTLNALFPEGAVQYAILPSDPGYLQSVQEKLEQQESEPTSETESGAWKDAHCAEDGFTTKIPANSTTEYRDVKGQMGFTVYLGEEGEMPVVIIYRRPIEAKFKNPEYYLNNTFREFLENKYEGNGGSVGTNPAKTWEIGGKQLLGARYLVKIGDNLNTQIQLIEIRDQGDVEYAVLYRGEEQEKLAMEALNVAVANYAED